MVALLTAVHLLVAVALILIVLLQSAKGTDLAGAFGGMGSQAAFGPRGTATFLSKATVALAAVFMATSITLSIIATRGGAGSILSEDETSPALAQPSPVAVTPPAPATGQTGVQVQGLEGAQVSVTVENPDGTTTTQPVQVQGGPAPAQPAPAGGAAAPSGQ